MKKVLAVILTISMFAILMAGCSTTGKPAAPADSSKTESAKKSKVGILVPTNNEWNQIYFEDAKPTAQKLGMEMTVFDPQNDVQQQINFQIGRAHV